MKRGVVFDLDETLIDRRGSLDIYARRLARDLSQYLVCDESAFVAHFHREDANGRVPRETFFRSLALATCAGVPAPLIRDHFREYAWVAPGLFPGVIETMGVLKTRGYVVGVVTNGSSWSQRLKLKAKNLVAHIDGFVISEEFGAKKPDPSIYAEISRVLGLNVTSSWFVGDDPLSDVTGPARFGFKTAWVNRYLLWPDKLPRLYELEIREIDEIPELLDGL